MQLVPPGVQPGGPLGARCASARLLLCTRVHTRVLLSQRKGGSERFKNPGGEGRSVGLSWIRASRGLWVV